MLPASSVSGFYFSHPDCRYFAVGAPAEDQLADYAARKNATPDEIRRWIGISH
jgi:5-methyltetrahydrofolate--homocysteine methyltransferase